MSKNHTDEITKAVTTLKVLANEVSTDSCDAGNHAYVPMAIPPAIFTKTLGSNVAYRGSSQPVSHNFGIS